MEFLTNISRGIGSLSKGKTKSITTISARRGVIVNGTVCRPNIILRIKHNAVGNAMGRRIP